MKGAKRDKYGWTLSVLATQLHSKVESKLLLSELSSKLSTEWMAIFHQHHQSTPSVHLDLPPKIEVVESKLDNITNISFIIKEQ